MPFSTFNKLFVLSALCLAAYAQADVSSALINYTQTAKALKKQVTIVKQFAPSCGMIGTQVASRMDEALTAARKQVTIVAAAVKDGGPDAKSSILEQIQAVNKINKELSTNLSLIQYGLSTDSPDCKKASAAFGGVSKLALGLPKALESVANELQ